MSNAKVLSLLLPFYFCLFTLDNPKKLAVRKQRLVEDLFVKKLNQLDFQPFEKLIWFFENYFSRNEHDCLADFGK